MTAPASPPLDSSVSRVPRAPAALDDVGGAELHLNVRAADGGVCDKEYQTLCGERHAEKCCCHADCSFTCCAEGQVCQDHDVPQCLPACASSNDCRGDAALGFLCVEHACVPRGCRADSDCAVGRRCRNGQCAFRPCTSNRDCDVGRVCSTSQLCASPFAEEPEPGCSSTGAGAAPSLLLAAIIALGIAAARARRRRPPGPLRTNSPR